MIAILGYELLMNYSHEDLKECVIDGDYSSKFGVILVSWLTSPLAGALLGSLIYKFTRKVILTATNPFNRGLQLFPALGGVSITVMVMMVMQRGAFSWSGTDLVIVVAVAGSLGVLVVVVIMFFVLPYLRNQSDFHILELLQESEVETSRPKSLPLMMEQARLLPHRSSCMYHKMDAFQLIPRFCSCFIVQQY